MNFQQLKETPEFKEKAAKRQAEKERVIASYSPEMWKKIKAKMLSKPFPSLKMEQFLTNNDPRIKVMSGRHWKEKERHQTIKYKFQEDILAGLFGIDWAYHYCRECGEVVIKEAVLLNGITQQFEVVDYTKEKPRVADTSGSMLDDVKAGIMELDEVLDYSPERLVMETRGGEY